METQCEGQNKEDDDDGELEERLEDVGDHEDVDAQEGEHLGHKSISLFKYFFQSYPNNVKSFL